MSQIVRLFILASCVNSADASVRGRSDRENESSNGNVAISPTLKPESAKKFFGKDYPGDKRPKVDVLHFKHPYPVVQDSDEFDRDYVKDENSDNGHWKAQTEYDRLRHKLAKEKADVAKALKQKEQAEKELKDAMARKKRAEDEAEKEHEAQKKHARDEAAKKERKDSGRDHNDHEQHDERSIAKKPTTSIPPPVDEKISTKEAQKAMDNLEECKKQLAEARERLKKLMKELEEAKRRQRETQAALDAAIARQKALEADKGLLDKEVKDQYQEYMDARAAYLKQKALVERMEADIEAAAAKVKAMRDAEDSNGGVYNTPKNSVTSSCMVSVLALALVLIAQLAMI